MTNVLLIILIIINFLPLLLSMLAPKPVKALNFESDMVFLNFLIGTKIQHFNRYVIQPARSSGKALMTDDDLIKYREGYVIEIIAHISPDYKRVLSKYFSDEGLRFYIVSALNDELTGHILNHNMKFFNKGNNEKIETVNTVRQADM